jgi:hypothetical protein
MASISDPSMAFNRLGRFRVTRAILFSAVPAIVANSTAVIQQP